MIIWVSSYPKSGNTWVRTFISTYYLSENEKFNFSMLKNIRQFPHEKFFEKKRMKELIVIPLFGKISQDVIKYLQAAL